MMASTCVEIQWNLTPFRSDEFVALWAPHAEAVIDFGASGYLFIRSKEDSQIVRQYAYFPDKASWEAYWNSERLIKARQSISGMYTVPIVYDWKEVITTGSVAPE